MASQEQNLLTASDAQARLEELVDEVTENPGTAVYVSHTRDAATCEAVLVDSVYYELLLLKTEAAGALPSTKESDGATG